MTENNMNITEGGDSGLCATDGLRTTGELAEACGITVRSVQYYDQKGLLPPSGYSEGGRRLYTEDDASRLRFILLLKAFGLKLSQIKGILESPHRETILTALLEERRAQLEEELAERLATRDAIDLMQADLKLFGQITTTSKAAMDDRMNSHRIDRKAQVRWWVTMIVVGILMDVAWIGALVCGIVSGVWWPFPVALALVVAAGLWVVVRYGAHATYLCPACKAEFRPRLGAFFVSHHTPTTRRLVCPCCGAKDWCVERYHAEPLALAPGECVPGTCRRSACCAGGGEVADDEGGEGR